MQYCPENAWYVACWSSELEPNGVLARIILDRPMVFFRTQDGEIGALEDRCPHRFAPLSKGSVRGEALQCPYHGLEFDRGGNCVTNPFGPILRSARTGAYPVEERHRAVWVWAGDEDGADPDLIPDFSFLADCADTAFSAGYMHTKANFEIVIDNIMDLTHTEYLHANSIAGNGMVHKAKPATRETPTGLQLRWFAPDVPLSPFHASLYAPMERADQLVQVDWYAPASIKLQALFIPLGRPEGEGFANLMAHLMTPETKKTTHYFFAATRNYQIEDSALNDQIAVAREQVFVTEDKPILELVQERMGNEDFWELKPLLLGVDEAAVRARRKIKEML